MITITLPVLLARFRSGRQLGKPRAIEVSDAHAANWPEVVGQMHEHFSVAD